VSGAGGSCSVTASGASHSGGWVIAMITIRINSRIHLVHEVGAVRTSIGGTMSGTCCGASTIAGVRAAHGGGWVVTTVEIRVNTWVSLVGNVG
jgi:hypothetical protein